MAGFNTIKTEVKARLGNRSDIESRLAIWINDAYFELLLSPRFSFFELDKKGTFETMDGTREYDVHTDAWFILSLRDLTNKRRIRRASYRQFDDLDETSKGLPIRYAPYGRKIEFDPTPDNVYTITSRYRVRPAELVADSSHLLGREWDEVLVALASAKGYEALEQQQKAVNARRLVEAAMAVREEAESLEDMDSETTIGVRT